MHCENMVFGHRANFAKFREKWNSASVITCGEGSMNKNHQQSSSLGTVLWLLPYTLLFGDLQGSYFSLYFSCSVFTARTMPLKDVRPSLCPSHAGILSKRLNVSSTFLWTPAQRKRASMLYFANVFFNFFYGRLILRPWWTEVRESFTRGGPWVSLKKLLLGFFSGHP